MVSESLRRIPVLNIDRYRKAPAATLDDHPPLDNRERFVVATVTFGYAFATATEKVAILLFPGTALQIALLIGYAIIGLLCWRGGMGIDIRKTLLFAAFCVAAGITAMANDLTASTFPSLLFLLGVYGLFIFTVPISKGAYGKILDNIVILGLIAAGLVFMDWLIQLVGMKMPSIEVFIPKNFLFFNYVYEQPIQWGSRWMKPNGYFFLETSFVSQFCAMSLIIEVCRRQRMVQLGVIAAGLLLSFGGTGLALILLTLPVIIFHVRPRLILVGILLLPLLFGAAIQSGLVDNIVGRSGEFSKEGSSGNTRFTAQFVRIGEVTTGPTREALVGIGPGRIPQHMHILWIAATKVVVEYGLIVSAFFWVFFLYSLVGRGVPLFASWMVIMMYFWLNGSFLLPICVLICVIIAGMYRVEDGVSGRQPRPIWRPRAAARWRSETQPRPRPSLPARTPRPRPGVRTPPVETAD